MPLKLSLKPRERFVVNGAVFENGDKRASLVVQNRASILREKDIMQEKEADTPAKRIYFPIMMMYLENGGCDEFYDEFAARMADFMDAVTNREALAACVAVSKDVTCGQYYRALMKCRKLIEYEGERLAYVTPRVSENAAQR